MKLTSMLQHRDYGYEVPPCSRKDLILHAHSLHRTLGYKGNCAFQILELIELVFPKIYNDFHFCILTKSEMGNNFGLTYPDKHTICLREDVYNDAVAGHGFSRMVASHEACHQLRHENIPLSLARRKATRETPPYTSSEWQANAMAGALLMPASKIINMSVQEIIDTYQVSELAAQIQLEKVKGEAQKWELPKL